MQEKVWNQREIERMEKVKETVDLRRRLSGS